MTDGIKTTQFKMYSNLWK